MMDSVIWPPIYKIKQHHLAKRVKLKISPAHGLEIVVPRRFNMRELSAILDEHKHWIIKHLVPITSSNFILPTQINLNAINEIWKINYVPCNKKLEMLLKPNHEISFVGKIADAKCKLKLINWLKQFAENYLFLQIKKLSQEINLFCESITIRDQQTRWGSCTAKKNISLNYKLIFLPQHLVTHVIIHELCHTKYFNHSEKFWNLVAKYDVDFQANRKELRLANKFIPAWIAL